MFSTYLSLSKQDEESKDMDGLGNREGFMYTVCKTLYQKCFTAHILREALPI